MLQNFSLFGFVWCFLMNRLGLSIIEGDTREGIHPSQCIIAGLSQCWNVFADMLTLVKCSLPDSPNITTFPFVISKYCARDILKLCRYLVSHKLCPLIQPSVNFSWKQNIVVLSWWFSLFFILSAFFNWNYFNKKFVLSTVYLFIQLFSYISMDLQISKSY